MHEPVCTAPGGRVVFFGSPPFAVDALQAVLAAGAEVVGVVSQPDRPAGRGNDLRAPAVKEFALAHGLVVYQPAKVRDGTLETWVRERSPDLAIVAAYGRILTEGVLAAPRRGCVNLHASLLPRWRGAAPIQRALAAGDAETGVCLMQMDAGLDTGGVLARRSVQIASDDTAASLERRLAALGAELVHTHFADIVAGRLAAVPQPAEGVRLAPPVLKSEGRIEWTLPAATVHAHVRAMFAWPAATMRASHPPEEWKVFPDGLGLADGAGPPGTLLQIVGDTGVIACGEGALHIRTVQRPGRRALPFAEVARGLHLQPGVQFG
ncbi:MAG: methionyl-tRNA formyltransferase [Myxococcales bacterium]|nr:methionyl-tRNA formyltransferase [Myxococcales bacterium]